MHKRTGLVRFSHCRAYAVLWVRGWIVISKCNLDTAQHASWGAFRNQRRGGCECRCTTEREWFPKIENSIQKLASLQTVIKNCSLLVSETNFWVSQGLPKASWKSSWGMYIPARAVDSRFRGRAVNTAGPQPADPCSNPGADLFFFFLVSQGLPKASSRLSQGPPGSPHALLSSLCPLQEQQPGGRTWVRPDLGGPLFDLRLLLAQWTMR